LHQVKQRDPNTADYHRFSEASEQMDRHRGDTLNNLFFARSQVEMSLAFHIVFAVIGMAMPLLMAVS